MFDLPVTLVGGYLGSGKTTYINHLLRNADGIRYAVLVNDFGELNIDEQLIENSDRQTVALSNGCVCCSMADDMAKAFVTIGEMADRIDWVLMEASGVANTTRLQSQVMNLPGFELKRTLTLVDASRIRELVDDKYVGQHVSLQLKQADEVRLSRLDLLSEVEQLELDSWFRSFDVNDDRFEAPLFESQVLKPDHIRTSSELEAWLNDQPSGTRRLKGFIQLPAEPEAGFLVQWVERRWSVTPVARKPEQFGLVRISGG